MLIPAKRLSGKHRVGWDAGVVICLGRGADLHMAQLMSLPLTVSCCSKFRLVLPHPGSPGENPRGS